MAKKALNQDIIREIRKTRSRFFSIFVLSALAVAFLAGLRTTAPDMEKTADRYLDEQNMMDIQILANLGLTDEDIAALSQRAGVQIVEGSYTADGLIPADDNDLVVKLLSITDSGINKPNLLSGRMPAQPNECLVEESLLTAMDADLGSSISISTGDTTYKDALVQERFTVVGTCQSPLYLSIQRGTSTLGTGAVVGFVMLPSGAFSMEAYTEIYLTLENAQAYNAYSSEYETLVDEWITDNENFGQVRAQLRSNSIREEVESELEKAEQEYADAELEVEQELADARADLVKVRRELDKGWADYRQGQSDLQQEIANAQSELDDAEQQLADAYIDLNEGEAEYLEGLAEYQDGLDQLQEGQAAYKEAYEEWQSGKRDYDAAYESYAQNRQELDESWAAYNAGMQDYEEAQSELENYRTQLNEAEEALPAAQEALSLAQQQLDALPVPGEDASAEEVAAYKKAKEDVQKAEDTVQLQQTTIAQLSKAIPATEAQLEESKQALDETREMLEEAEAQLAKGKAELDAAKEELDAGRDELAAAKEELDAAEEELHAGKQELLTARQRLDNSWIEYDQGLLNLEEGRKELEEETTKAQQELADARIELNKGEAEYTDGLISYEEGKTEAETELAKARSELRDAHRSIDELEECEWYILSRTANMGFISYQQDAERMGNLATVFPLLFFMVAALVCLTTMTCMVEEQRSQIGCLKALGYSKLDIAWKYIGYGLLASLSGSLVGLLIGCTLIPWIIITAWQILYNIPGLAFAQQPTTYIFSILAAVGCNIVAVLAAAMNVLRAAPATLMRPRAPKIGKRVLLEHIRPIWTRLSFIHKVTVRNLLRYKKRFWMTVVGIVGCTALIVTGFGLRDSILDIMEIQYDEIYDYHAQASLVNHYSDEELQEIEEHLAQDDRVAGFLPCSQTSIDMEGLERTINGYMLVVSDTDELDGFIDLRRRADQQPVNLADSGLVLTEKAAELLNLGIGDTLVISSGDERAEATISGITENYIMHYAYLTDAYYKQLFGKEAKDNTILLSYTENSETMADAVSSELISLDGITSVSRIAATRETLTSSMESVDYAVVLIIICAAALAFVVLYNLTNINITERLRELATLKVLGFNDREMAAYVYRENVLLTLLGVALGMVVGKFLHQWLVLTVEIDMVMFGRTAQTMSYVYAAGLTILFSLLVNLSANRKLQSIDMVESLKAVE